MSFTVSSHIVLTKWNLKNFVIAKKNNVFNNICLFIYYFNKSKDIFNYFSLNDMVVRHKMLMEQNNIEVTLPVLAKASPTFLLRPP